MAVALVKEDIDYAIKPEAATPSISTSDWPLLLKDYDKRMFLSIHAIACQCACG